MGKFDDFFDDVVVNAKTAAEAVSKKAAQVYDASRHKFTAAEIRGDINNKLKDLGKFTYKERVHGVDMSAEINAAIAEIKELKENLEIINNHLDDSDLSIDMIADEVGISRVHLHRKMKELTGQTPHDFIRNIRLKRAATLLAGHGMNVTEVMYACGFSNSTSFSTVFKKFYGMSPRDYMREHDKQ